MATPTFASGTSTPFELDPEEAAKSLKVSLADRAAKAAALYAHKQYEEASEVYAQAAEMQAEMNGEMSPENADILFLYGRALFKVGQSKSDVLGGKAPETKKSSKPKPTKQAKSTDESVPGTAEKKNGAAEVAGSSAAAEESKPEQKKALFQFEGDENFEDSEEGEDAEEGEGEDEEEEDDLAVAFEILDLARVLFHKRLESVQAENEAEQGKGKEAAEEDSGNSATIKHIKERLADTHDLLAEIELENERYVAGS
jgi:HAT1-interacting factor 1